MNSTTTSKLFFLFKKERTKENGNPKEMGLRITNRAPRALTGLYCTLSRLRKNANTPIDTINDKTFKPRTILKRITRRLQAHAKTPREHQPKRNFLQKTSRTTQEKKFTKKTTSPLLRNLKTGQKT